MAMTKPSHVGGLGPLGLGLLLAAGVGACAGLARAEPGDEPADRAFLQAAAQAYYDALARKDFAGTAGREVFAVQATPHDQAAYARAMDQHPYAGAERIGVTIRNLDSSQASLELTLTARGRTTTNQAVWSRTGTPAKWVPPMTRLTLAGMPGFEAFSGKESPEKPDEPKGPAVTSTAVFKERHLQEGQMASGTNGAVRFVRPPKVMPARNLGKEAYVLGYIENVGQAPVSGLAVRVEVRSEDGQVIETKVFRPATPRLEPGRDVTFDGTLDHLDPKRTEFSLEWAR